jgi:putative DNA primase/helicase
MHRTFIDRDGNKLGRKLMPGEIPPGSAIRLMPHEDILGVAEGIETSFAASILFNVPCWPTLNSSLLKTFEPPPGPRRYIVFGDNDLNFVGQAAAYELARRFSFAKLEVDVQIPDAPGDDWYDVFHATKLSATQKGSLPWHQ